MTFSELTPEQVHPALERFHVIDVREPHEFLGPLGFIAGAELVPLATVGQDAPRLAGVAPLLLVCRSGKRSGMACEKLLEHGDLELANLTGGMIAWNRAGLPVHRAPIETHADLLDSVVAWLAMVSGSDRQASRTRVEALLGEAGATLASPTIASIDHALAGIEAQLGHSSAPPDLDLVLEAFRRDLAVL